MIERAPDGVLVLDWPRIAFLNSAAADLLGFADVQAGEGADIRSRLVPADGEQGDPVAAWFGAARATAAVPQYHCTAADGSERAVEISSIPIEYLGANCTLAFARDVTARNDMASKLLETDKLAAVGTLAAGVAHEINNPLGYLMLNLDLLARDLPHLAAHPEGLEDAQQRLKDAQHGAERVRAIVRDLQTLTRKDEELRGPIVLADVADSAIQLARHEIRQRARLERHFKPVPPVLGNPTRLEQLLMNLLFNAVHALDNGDPSQNRIDVTIAPAPCGMVTVEVVDTGCGMPEAVMRKAFEPFFTTKAPNIGTGLGLPICRGIVQSMGGDIELESEPGRGTRVRVRLPGLPAKKSAGEEGTVTTGAAGTSTSEPGDARAQTASRVLLVDDDQTVAESLAYAIGEHHDVSVAHSASQARKALALGHYDAVVCDLAMPGETGIELYESVRSQQPATARRFIFMTGGAFLPSAERFLEETANPHIDKPFELAQLNHLLEDVLRS